MLRNPLDAEVNLSSLTVTVEEILLGRSVPSESTVEVIDDMVLGPKETRTVGRLRSLHNRNSRYKCVCLDTRGSEIQPSRIDNYHTNEI